MISEKIINKIQKKIPKEVLTDLQDIVIYQEQDGSYNLYNVYQIVKNEGLYTVISPSLRQPLTFNSLKNAVAWCAFDKQAKVYVSKRIVELDQRLVGLDADITLHQSLVSKTKNTDSKLVYLAKLVEEKLKRKQIKEELEGYIVESVSWQQRRFDKKPA